MAKPIFIDMPADFSFRHTVFSHGWYDLLPFELDTNDWKLRYVFRSRGANVPATISESDGRVRIDTEGSGFDKKKLASDVRHILRLDDDVSPFHSLIRTHSDLSWAAKSKAGRLLRSPTVFEDLIKTICTTNCSWSLTRTMVSKLVTKLGAKGSDETRSFPDASAMASVSESFYRDEIKAGYRAPYLLESAERVCAGELDPEAWLRSELPTAELKKEIKNVKGVGDYAAENLLKLLGRYDGLALDSWLRGQFYKKRNGEKVCSDSKIERYYKRFGPWKGLAIWCDMTERWHDNDPE